MKKAISLLLVLVLLVSMFAGCAKKDTSDTDAKNETTAEKKKITVMVDHDYRIDDIGSYLIEKYPDVEFDIYLGRSGVAYLKKAAENNNLPDIIISGSTWGRAGSVLGEYLYDFSTTDIASEFYSVYLDNYTNSDGSVYWLPGCAAIEGIMVNKTLFDENGIDLPTDYESFVDVCEKFTSLGIRPFASDYKYDYTCAYLLQALSIPLLQSASGKEWRLSYEEGDTDILDETIGLQMFEKLEAFFELTGVTEDDAKRGYGATFGDLTSGNIAMIRQSTNNSSYYEAGLTDLVILPYFGETENDSWYFTTPSYAVGMSAEVKGSDIEDTCLDIVRRLFSQECMDIFAEEVQAFTAYNKGITFDVKDEFTNIIPYVESNHMYTYLSENNFQAASKIAVQKMIAENATPEEALQAFNEALNQDEEAAPAVAAIDTAYTREWTSSGNKALSAVVNTLADIIDCDILLAPSTISASSIYSGDYTSDEIDNLLYGGGVNFYKKNITGAEIKSIVAAAVAGFGSSYDPITVSTLPAISGAKMTVSRTDEGDFVLDGLTVDGKAIDDNSTYTFVYTDNSPALLREIYNWNKEDHDGFDIAAAENAEGLDVETYEGFIYPAEHVADFWRTYFTEGGTVSEPSDYIELK